MAVDPQALKARMAKAAQHNKDLEKEIVGEASSVGQLPIVSNSVFHPERIPPDADQLIVEETKRRFLDRWNKPITRGDGSFVKIKDNDWKIIAIAEVFDFDVAVLSNLEHNQDEIINQTPAADLMLQIEIIKQLRAIRRLLSVDKETPIQGTNAAV